MVGVVSFKSNIASKLPVTTTKRGIDASSDVYLRMRRKMIDGMRIYVDYTNKWKNRRKEEREKILSKPESESLSQIVTSDFENIMTTTRDGYGGKVYKPILPVPSVADDGMRTIKFSKHKDEIVEIAKDYFEDETLAPNSVGIKCFEEILYKSRQD